DGGSEDLVQEAGQFGDRILRMPTRSGPAAARNLGARAARNEFLLFIDADVVVPPTVVGQVRKAFRDRPEYAAVIGSYDDSPSASNFLSQYKNLLQHYVHQHAHKEGYTFWGACGAIRRDVLLASGGFDERYRAQCIEDIELGYRLKAAGCRIQVCKDIQVTHQKRWTAFSLFRSDFFRRALPWAALILRSGRL